MDRAEASRTLGIPPDASLDDARRAYRALIRTRHPDQAGPGATAEAARIIAAWSLLRAEPAPVAVPGRAPDEAVAHEVVTVEGDTVGIALPTDEAFELLVDCAHDLGEVTYVDPHGGLLQAVVELFDGVVCSLVVDLQGRADRVEAFCTVDRLDGGPPLDAGAIADLLGRTALGHLLTGRP